MSVIIHELLHFIGNWAFNSICLYACSRWINGVTLIPTDGVPIYILVMELGLILTLLNALIRPILLHLLLPLNGLTIGFFSLVINGFFIFVLSRFSPSFSVSNLGVGILATFVFAILNIILQILIPIDDDVMLYNVISQRNRAKNAVVSNKKGIVMLEIDGLSYPRLLEVMEKGYMPFLKELIDSGQYTVRGYDCGVPSQTSSCQAGIMFGRNENICAFRWYDKEKHKVYSSSNPGNATEIEKMLFPDGKPTGILDNGLSVNNIISGNAEENILTISQLLPKSREEQQKRNRDLTLLSIRPYLLTKALLLTVFDAGSEVLNYFWDCIRGKQPRLNRLHNFYPFIRGATNVLLRDISTAMLADAISSGREAMYTTFIGYDEIAHHSGPDSAAAHRSLSGIDKAIRKVFEAATISKARPYDVVILSDHGQTFGATFKQRYQTTLGDTIKSLAIKYSLLGKALKVISLDDDEDNNANVMAVLKSLSNSGPGTITRKAAEALENAVSENEEVQKAVKAAEDEANDILVLASGNLVNAYFGVSDKRMTYDEIEAVYPGMISELITHPGVGLIMVHTGEGSVAIGKDGQKNLYSGEVTGSDPLIMYNDPEKRTKQLRYLMDFPNGGDLVIISPLYEDGTVAAYEELIGSHGGLGGQQTDPFLMFPAAFAVEDEIINANQVYSVLKTIKNSPVVESENAADSQTDSTSPGAMWRQIKDVKHWVPNLIRSTYFSGDAYKTIAWDPAYNGPGILIGLISFLCTWATMNSYLGEKYSPAANFIVLAVIYSIAILAGYLAVVALRGKKEPWKIGRAFLFTSYWGILSLFILTRHAVLAWSAIVILMQINALSASAMAASKLKKNQIIPLFLVLLLIIPILITVSLALYNFITFSISRN